MIGKQSLMVQIIKAELQAEFLLRNRARIAVIVWHKARGHDANGSAGRTEEAT